MTTPAVNIDRQITTSSSYDSQWVGEQAVPVTNPVIGKTGLQYQSRPASGSSPVRPDGSRAPRAWNHQWCMLDFGASRQSLLATRGTRSQWTSGFVPCFTGTRSGLTEAGGGWVFGSGLFPYMVEAQARTRALSKLADGKADLGNTLGELRQTAAGVTEVCNQIFDGFSAAAAAGKGLKREVVREILNFGKVKPRRKREPAAAARKRMQREGRVLDAWMQVQMSIKPTVMDIDQIGHALSDSLFVEKRAFRATIKAGAEDTVTGNAVQNGHVGWGGNARAHLDVSWLAQCHISAVFDVPVSGVRDMNQWGIANPASVAWELTAFSWLVDYVVDVGGWLESLSATAGTQFIEGSISRLMKMVECTTQLKVSNPGTTWKILVTEPGLKTSTAQVGRMSRSLLGALHPSLLPPLKKRIGLTQMANALTVLANLVR